MPQAHRGALGLESSQTSRITTEELASFFLDVEGDSESVHSCTSDELGV